MDMSSGVWKELAVMMSTENSLGWGKFVDGTGPLPEVGKLWFWCSSCRAKFSSVITPTHCPNGCSAENDKNRTMLTHKGYTAATFPFYSILCSYLAQPGERETMEDLHGIDITHGVPPEIWAGIGRGDYDDEVAPLNAVARDVAAAMREMAERVLEE